MRAASVKVQDTWIAYFKLFVPDVEGEVKPLDISISRSTLQNVLQVHTTWWSGTAWNPELPRTDAEELVANNNWLDYVCLPSRTASTAGKKIAPNDPIRHAVGAVRFGTVKKSPPTFVQAGPMDPWALMQKALLDALVHQK